MKKKWINLIVLFLPLFLQAQVTIGVLLPPSGLVQKDQLWNLMLTNSGTSALDVNVVLNLQDAATGQPVLSAVTRTILLGKGAKPVSLSDIQPIQYTYSGPGASGTYLPLGNYIACYSLTRSSGERIESLGDECVRININPLSPPLLNTPADKAILQTPPQQFTWVPPAPLNMFDNLSYDIAVAEVLEGQAPSDAILYNVPSYTKQNAKLTSETYPSTFRKLEEGKTYAWQVTARNGQTYSAPTEVWTFSIAKDSVQKQHLSATYIMLKKSTEPSGVSYVSGDQLYIKYYSYDKEHETVVRFYKDDGTVIKERKQKIAYGDNFHVFPLGRAFQQGKTYIVEISDSQNNRYTAAFSIK